MDKALAQEIAQLVLQGLWASKVEFLVALGVWAVLSGAFAFAGAWLAKVAEGRVADRRFEILKRQLAANTRVVQQIQTDVAHRDWTAREWKGARIKNLEPMLELAIEALPLYYQTMIQFRKGDTFVEDLSRLTKLRTIQTLYYPELHQPVTKLIEACHQGIERAKAFREEFDGSLPATRRAAIDRTAGDLMSDKLAMQKALFELVGQLQSLVQDLFGLQGQSGDTGLLKKSEHSPIAQGG